MKRWILGLVLFLLGGSLAQAEQNCVKEFHCNYTCGVVSYYYDNNIAPVVTGYIVTDTNNKKHFRYNGQSYNCGTAYEAISDPNQLHCSNYTQTLTCIPEPNTPLSLCTQFYPSNFPSPPCQKTFEKRKKK